MMHASLSPAAEGERSRSGQWITTMLDTGLSRAAVPRRDRGGKEGIVREAAGPCAGAAHPHRGEPCSRRDRDTLSRFSAKCRPMPVAPAVSSRHMTLRTYITPKASAKKTVKTKGAVDVAARYLVYKLYEATDGRPKGWCPLRGLGEHLEVVARAASRCSSRHPELRHLLLKEPQGAVQDTLGAPRGLASRSDHDLRRAIPAPVSPSAFAPAD